MPRIPGQFRRDNPAPPIIMKNILFSRTVIFSLLALLAKLSGLDEDATRTLAERLFDLWPVALAMGADAGSIIARVRQTQFSRPTSAVWLTLLSAVISLASAFGLDLSGLQDLTHRVMEQLPALSAVAASALALWGQLKAKRKLTHTAAPGHLLSVFCVLSILSLSASAAAPAHRLTGWIQDTAGIADPSIARLRLSAGTIAAQSDLRAQMPPVYDQGQVGSCTGNGIAAILDYARRKQNSRLRWCSPSRLFIYFEERRIEGTINEDAGAMIRTGIDVITDTGVCRESRWPYIERNWPVKPSARAYADACNYQALHGYKCDNGDARSIRLALSNGYPVVFGSLLYSGIDRVDRWHPTLEMPRKGESPAGGHCMVIVGHNDTTRTYIVRNSWGIRWCLDGHFYVPYDYIHSRRLTGDCWVIDRAK